MSHQSVDGSITEIQSVDKNVVISEMDICIHITVTGTSVRMSCRQTQDNSVRIGTTRGCISVNWIVFSGSGNNNRTCFTITAIFLRTPPSQCLIGRLTYKCCILLDCYAERRRNAVNKILQHCHYACGLGICDATVADGHFIDNTLVNLRFKRDSYVAYCKLQTCRSFVENAFKRNRGNTVIAESKVERKFLNAGQFDRQFGQQTEYGVDECRIKFETDGAFRDVNRHGNTVIVRLRFTR